MSEKVSLSTKERIILYSQILGSIRKKYSAKKLTEEEILKALDTSYSNRKFDDEVLKKISRNSLRRLKFSLFKARAATINPMIEFIGIPDIEEFKRQVREKELGYHELAKPETSRIWSEIEGNMPSTESQTKTTDDPISDWLYGRYYMFGLEEESELVLTDLIQTSGRTAEDLISTGDFQWTFFYTVLEFSTDLGQYHFGLHDYKGSDLRESGTDNFEYRTEAKTTGLEIKETRHQTHLFLSIGEIVGNGTAFFAHSFFRKTGNGPMRLLPFINVEQVRRSLEHPFQFPPNFTYSAIGGVVKMENPSELNLKPGRGLSESRLLERGVTSANIKKILSIGRPLLAI